MITSHLVVPDTKGWNDTMTAAIPEKRLFGTNGTRGVVGIDMTPDLVLRIGAAFGSMRKGKIAVGRDTRTSGEMLIRALQAGLLSAGCDVIDCGILPTPALQYVVRGQFAGGAMITASHNPPEYNGVKIIEADGTEMGDEETLILERQVFEQSYTFQPWERVGRLAKGPDLIKQYTNAIVDRFPNQPCDGLLVALDPGSGAACTTTPEILRRIGCRVLTVNGVMDGTFSGRLPEPSPEGLAVLSDLVVSSGAAFGIAHDGDADRAVFVDERGHYIEENMEFALIARHVCSGQKGLVVTPVSTSQIIEEVVRDAGCSVVYTKVGSIHVARTMLDLIEQGKQVVFGGEGNGGLIYPNHQFCRDGGMTAAIIAETVSRTRTPLSALVSNLPKRFMIKGKVTTEYASQVIADMQGAFLGDAIDRLDGLKIIRGNTWALIRASGTEPLIRIVVESVKREQAESFYREVVAVITQSMNTYR